ncbi:MAG: hypothetical protein HYV36_07410 [Lentisphaerae bacterium]|nr:hypothetical protein [Lentisphaerota bacterium]
MALFFPADAAVSAYRYRGGSGDGWDSRQASPAMYGGGTGAGSGMNLSTNVRLSDLSSFLRGIRASLEEETQTVHWYIYDLTQVHDYDRTAPFGVHWFMDLSVKCSSGWEESGLSQTPQTAWLIPAREYPLGTYTTTWYHADFYDKRIVFTVDTNEVRNFVYLDPRWTSPYRVLAAITSEGTNYLVNAWLEEPSGAPATDAGNCQVSIVDAGASAIASASQASPNGDGFFRLPIDISGITNANNTYLANIGIADFNGNRFSNTITFSLSDETDFAGLYQGQAEILSNTTVIIAQTEGIRTNTAWLGTSYASLSASFNTLNPKIDTLGVKMDASLSGIGSIQTAVGATESETLYSKAAQTLNTVTGLPSAITREAKKGVQSKILNRPTSTTNGATLLIRYKTDTGKAPTINVYDQNAGALVADGLMTEISATGVYEYNLSLKSTWPLGEYTIICSEATTGSADSMTLKVVANEAVAVDFSPVFARLDTLDAQLSGVASDQSAMNATLSAQNATLTTIQTDISAINATIATMADDINTLLANWNALNMTELKSKIDLLAGYLGTPNDASGMQTLFGKIAQTYGLVNQIPIAAVFAEVQAFRKEIDFQGKTDTTYSMLAGISEALEDLQAGGTAPTEETVSTGLEEAAQTIQETRETISAIAKQAGVGNVVALSAAGGKELSLQSLYDQMTELKALSQAIYDLLRQREKPVVNSWLESGSVKKRIFVANNSQTVEEFVPVRQYLPEGVKPEDIISMGDFELGYDFYGSLYYVHQMVRLAPGANVTLEVVMNDIWRIDEAEIVMFRDHVKQLVKILEQSRYIDQVKVLSENIYRRLDRIIQVQNTVTTTERRLSNYEMNKVALEEVKVDIGNLEDLVVEVQGLPTDKIMGTISPLPTVAGLAEVVKQPKRKITLKIAMENPLAISNTFPLEFHLPAEINPSLITDLGELEVLFDSEKKLHYLASTNLAFAPREKKIFAVVLTDVWFIPDQQLDALLSHTEKLVAMFAESEARLSAEFLGKRIKQKLSAIRKSQQQLDLAADVHIGNCRLNKARMEDVKNDIGRLERLIVQTGGSPAVTVAARDVKIKEGGVIPAAGSKARALGTVRTWKIIWTMIIFAGVISFLFFVIWWMQIKARDAVKLEKLEGAGKAGKSGKS